MDSFRLRDAIARGQQWLDQNKRTWESKTENGYSFKDNFAELLMLEVTGRWYVSFCSQLTTYSHTHTYKREDAPISV